MADNPLLLALSTSSPALSIALFDDGSLLARRHELIGRGHAEALVPAVADLLGAARPGRILIDTGPGSYTGIRIGIAAARALGLAWGVPVFGISALALVAAQAFAADAALQELLCLIDAGRGQAIGAMMGRDLVAPVPARWTAVPAGVPVAGGGARLLDAPVAPLHDSHPDAGFAAAIPAAAHGPPTALYVAD